LLRIYLDQFAWIGLSRAAHGKPEGAKYVDALAMCRAAKKQGVASFPIDLYRYFETQKNHNDGSRNRLVDTIIELSDFDTLVLPQTLLDYELDVALREHFGRPAELAQPRVFGRGITHLSNGRVHNAMRPTDQRLLVGQAGSDLRTPIDRELEEALLRAGPKDHARASLPIDLVDWGNLYAQHEVKVANDIASRNVGREDLLAAVVHADYSDIVMSIRARMDAAEITPNEMVEKLGDIGILRLVHDLPTRRVTNVLRASKHVHPQKHQKWKPSDFVDVVSLPVPVVYCDVVFTEEQWVRALTRDKSDVLGERYGTKLIHDPDHLVNLLVGATF
jgi:hypothetical protein